MDDREFLNWKALIEDRIGLYISPERRSFFISGLRSRMRDVGCSDYIEYFRYMSAKSGRVEEWTLLADCLTVHETCFFRHTSSMKLVSDYLLPAVYEKSGNFHAWSVGCATGEEAYSLAMLVDQYVAGHDKKLYFGITGTDISLPSLRKARAGVYLNRRLRNIDQTYQKRYCRPVSTNRFEVSRALRKRVCFSQLNLKDVSDVPFEKMDLIFCQNLLIYYGRERRVQIVDHLAGCLRPGGVLVLGPGELTDWKHPEMEKVRYEDTLAYQRAN